MTRLVLTILGLGALAAIGWLLIKPPGPAQPGAGMATAMRGVPREVGVVTAPVVTMDFAQQIEALGTAQANESVDVTTKVSSLVTRIRFEEGSAG